MRLPKSAWEIHIKEFLGSSMNKIEFCKTNKLSYRAFWYWLHKLSFEDTSKEINLPKPKPSFLPVRVSNINKSKAPAKIKLKVNNVIIIVEENFSPNLLKQAISVLKEC